MASYSLVLKPSVEKDLRHLPKSVIARVMARLEELKEEPFPRQALKLEGGEGFYRVPIGDYRVVYAVDTSSKQLTIHYVRHRRDVYRKI